MLAIDDPGPFAHCIPLEGVADASPLFPVKLDGCIQPVLIPPPVRH